MNRRPKPGQPNPGGSGRAHGVALANDLGLDYLQFFVNDLGDVEKGVFKLSYHADDIVAMAAAAKPMLVGITAWLIPSRSYIEAAAKVLVPLCKQIDAASLVWDAETPWVKGTGMTHQDAAELVAQEFAELPCAMGMTGFPAVPKTATRPLTDVCSFGMPQAYSFWDAQHNRPGTNSVPLETGQKEWWATWQKNFVVGRTSPFLLVMGLASYQQAGLSSSVLDAMQTAVEASTAVGATNICYWQLKYFDPARNGANQQVYDAMRSITGAT